jgi:hypothetical protein
MLVTNLSDALGESKLALLDLSGKYRELGNALCDESAEEFGKLGIETPTVLVENVSLPPEVEAALDKRSSMGIVGDLNNYAKFQTAEAIRDAAKNPGTAGAVVGLGMGQVFGGMMGQAATGPAGSAGSMPPPMPTSYPFFIAVNGAQQGPFEVGLVGNKVRSGEISRDTLVWQHGMAGWTRAGDVSALAQLFPSTPPPLPR